ncbi:fumarylacetoacetate hydrolase family protein [Dankookia sp. P2]|uniref:fumarylacetoacetate hydrolase family protein n=1 Tax=Dankookia sp. P2 TaxID=3423955 RepID=UPI003D674FF7
MPSPLRKVLCVGLNYRAHVAESAGREVPENPRIFARLADTIIAHGAPLWRPVNSTHFDYEGELAVVIGKPGRRIPAAHALDHVAAYTIFNDGSLRDYQKHSVTAGKNFPGTGPLGPWLVTADELPNPAALTLETRVNGERRQHAKTSDMILSVPQLIEYISAFTPLAPGDVIATGTPEGVAHARKPPPWLVPGDVVEVEISGIGILRNPVVAEPA